MSSVLRDAPTIPSVVRKASREFGSSEYLVTPDSRLSFRDLDLRSQRLAMRLLRSRVGKGTRVGIWFPQGPDFVVALMAVARIGALAVPLSTFARGAELRRMIRHSDIDTLVAPQLLLGRDTADELEALLPELRAATRTELFLAEAPYLRAVWIVGESDRRWATTVADLAAPEDEGGPDDPLLAVIESEVMPSDAMVMVFTSGATAEPKAVVHTHGSQVRHSANLAALHGLTSETRTFTTTPFFWVGGLTVMLLTHLHVGATVITVERMDGQAMLELIERTSPTRVLGWTLVDRITSDPRLAARELGWLVDLQPPSLVHPGRRHGSLGMTETGGPHSAPSAAEASQELPDDLRGSFGRPVPGVQHKIVDPDTGVELSEGTVGEILVRGAAVMDAIYKSERTDTFDADGWYRTGDLGSLRDGYLFFTGRRTEMIKTAGANVSPREVELAVEALAGVKAAFVVGVPDDARDEVVACLVCPEPGCDIGADEVAAQLREQLSGYKVPRRILVVPFDEAPWLPTGKLSRPRLVEALSAVEADYQA